MAAKWFNSLDTNSIKRTNLMEGGLYKNGVLIKGHSFCKQCLHDLQFMKTRYSSPNLSKVARVDISCQFKETRYLCRHCLQNEWTLAGESKMARTILLFSWVESIHLRWKNLSYKASHFLTNWEVIYGSPLILLELQSLFDMAETRQKGCVLK